MSKPTQEQEKELWEWCGWHHWESPNEYLTKNWWHSPDKADNRLNKLPSLDLNNLFKYAPLTCGADLHIKFHEVHWVNGKIWTECSIIQDNDEIGKGFVEGKLKDVGHLALFWAMYGAVK